MIRDDLNTPVRLDDLGPPLKRLLDASHGQVVIVVAMAKGGGYGYSLTFAAPELVTEPESVPDAVLAIALREGAESLRKKMETTAP